MAGSIVLMYFKLVNIENKWEIVKKHCTNKHRTPLMGLGEDRHIVRLGVIIDPTWSSHPINTSHSVPLIIPFLLPDASKVKRVLEHFWNFEVATLTHSALRKSLIFNQIDFSSFLHFYQFCTQIPSWSRSHWTSWFIVHCLIKPDQGSGRWLKAGELRGGNKLSSPTD